MVEQQEEGEERELMMREREAKMTGRRERERESWGDRE